MVYANSKCFFGPWGFLLQRYKRPLGNVGNFLNTSVGQSEISTYINHAPAQLLLAGLR